SKLESNIIFILQIFLIIDITNNLNLAVVICENGYRYFFIETKAFVDNFSISLLDFCISLFNFVFHLSGG
ncbi:hypothetical protein DW046_17055, partial [Bacteroides stercoris]